MYLSYDEKRILWVKRAKFENSQVPNQYEFEHAPNGHSLVYRISVCIRNFQIMQPLGQPRSWYEKWRYNVLAVAGYPANAVLFVI